MKVHFLISPWRIGLRRALGLVLCSCLIAFGLAMPVHAATYFFHFSPPAIALSSCDNIHNTIQGPFDLNVLGGMTYSMVATVNGVAYAPATGTYPTASSGSGFTYVWGLVGYGPLALPYPVSWAFTLSQGTQWLSKATISFDCTTLGITNIQVTNIDFNPATASMPNGGIEFCNTIFAPDSPISVHYAGWSIFGYAQVDPYVPHKVGLGLGPNPVLDHQLVLEQGGTQLVVTLLQTTDRGLNWTLIRGQASHCPAPK